MGGLVLGSEMENVEQARYQITLTDGGKVMGGVVLGSEMENVQEALERERGNQSVRSESGQFRRETAESEGEHDRR